MIKITNRLNYYYIDSSESHVGGMYFTKQELISLHKKISKILAYTPNTYPPEMKLNSPNEWGKKL